MHLIQALNGGGYKGWTWSVQCTLRNFSLHAKNVLVSQCRRMAKNDRRYTATSRNLKSLTPTTQREIFAGTNFRESLKNM